MGAQDLPTSWGSSPLTRGALAGRTRWSLDDRLIPAHAGSTDMRDLLPPTPQAHPRSRGEHVTVPRQSGKTTGSSPLTRGARRIPVARREAPRLIPAHAGSTHQTDAHSPDTSAHPRSRGEHNSFGDLAWFQADSSPLTRGARAGECEAGGRGRLIPAHAGSTKA